MIYDAVIVIAVLILAAAVSLLIGTGKHTALKDPVYTFCLFSVWFLYLGWCWHKGGMTLGMRAWRVRIQDDRGEPPGWGRCLLRFGVSLISALAAGMGFLWSFLDSEKRTWHDRVSGTRLIRF